MKKNQILILIICLFVVEHTMLPVAISIDELASGRSALFQNTTSRILGLQLGLLLVMFVIRVVLWILPLLRIFTEVANKRWVKNIFFFAVINVMSNILISVVYFMIWVPDLIETELINMTIVITFISPFILNSLPFSRRYVQRFMAQTS